MKLKKDYSQATSTGNINWPKFQQVLQCYILVLSFNTLLKYSGKNMKSQ